jgi:Mg2+ and Co2+ transporter CorA
MNATAHSQAEFTASIAIESKRDSTAMKAIAFLTTLFLPGAFVATFFSMTMFDWAPSNDSQSPKVSKYIWLYWVITIPLTLLVMISLLFWARWEYRKSAKQLDSSKKRKGVE